MTGTFWLQRFREALQGVQSQRRRRKAASRVQPRLFVLEDRLAPATVTWVNPAGGDWDTASNWVDQEGVNRVPGPGDNALIDISGITVTHSLNTAESVLSLTSQANISFSSGSLTANDVEFDGSATIGGSYSVSASTSIGGEATVAFTGTVTSLGSVTVINGGLLDLTGANLTSSATTLASLNMGLATLSGGTTASAGTLRDSAALTVTGALTLAENGVLTGGGSVTVQGGADVRDGNCKLDGFTLNNASGSTLTLVGNFQELDGAVLNNYGTFYNPEGDTLVSDGTGVINNYGLFERNGGGTSIPFTFNDYGTVDSQQGGLYLYGHTYNAGTFSGAPAGFVQFIGPYSDIPSASIQEPGGVAFQSTAVVSGSYSAGGTSVVAATVALTGTVTSLGSVTVIDGAVLDLTGANLTPSATTLASLNMGLATLSGGTTASAGTLRDSAALTVTGALTLAENGVLTGGGSVTVQGGADVRDGNPTLKNFTVNNAVGSTLTLVGSLQELNGAVLNNYGTFYNPEGDTLVGDGTGVINNYGLFEKNGGGTSIPFAFNNYGTVDLQQGALYLYGCNYNAGTFSGATAGFVEFIGPYSDIPSASIQVPGGVSFSSSAAISGSISGPAGSQITFEGSTAVLTPTARINADSLSLQPASSTIQISGNQPGTGFPSTTVETNVTLAGQLQIAMLNGFVPSLGQQFEIINNQGSNPVSGTFSGLPEGATFGFNGGVFQITYKGGDGNDVVLTCVMLNPGPQTSYEGVAVSLPISAIGADAGTFSATGLPPGLSISGATGAISGTLTTASAGSYNVIVSAAVGSMSFPWTVVVPAPGTVTWINPAGGDWDMASNWVDEDGVNRVPGGGDSASINMSGITVTHSLNAAESVLSLASQANISFSSGSLTANNVDFDASATIGSGYRVTGSTLIGGGAAVAFTGTVDLTGSTLEVFGTADFTQASGLSAVDNLLLRGTLLLDSTLTVTGPAQLPGPYGMILSGGTVGGSGALNVQTSSLFSGGGINLNVPVSNSGAMTMDGASITLGTGVTLTNQSGSLLEGGDAGLLTGGTLINQAGGTLLKFQGSNYNEDYWIINTPLQNAGLLEVQGRSLTLAGGASNSGSYVVDGALSLAGPLTFTAGASVSGPGSVEFGSSTTLPGTYTVSGGTTIDSAAAVAFTGTVDLTGSTLEVFGTADFTQASGLSAVDNLLLRGTLLLDSTLTVTGPAQLPGPYGMILSGGTVGGSGALNVQTSSLFSGGGINLNVPVSNSGAMTMDGASITLGTGVTLTNQSGSLLEGGDAGLLTGGTLINQAGGTLLKFQASNYNEDYWIINTPLQNAGLLEVQGRSLTLGGGASNSGSYVVDAGTTLSFAGGVTYNSGTITGLPGADIFFGGSAAVFAPTAQINADSLQLQPGSLTLQISSNQPGAGFASTNIGTNVTLGGQLQIAMLNGFVPTVGQKFQIINNQGSNPVSGTFSGLPEGATFGFNGGVFQITYQGGDGNDVVLTCVMLNPGPQINYEGVTVSLPISAIGADVGTFSTTGLPPGLSISQATGTISGTLTTTSAGGYNVVVSAAIGSVSFPWTVLPQIPTTTSVLSNYPSGSVYGQTDSFTAVVSPLAGSIAPAGSVQFQVDGANFGPATPLSGGQAVLTTSTLGAGQHTVTAIYTSSTSTFGNSNDLANPLTQMVNQAPLTITANNTSKIYGSPNPAFTVTYASFVNGEGPSNLGGSLSFTTTATTSSPVGTYTVTAGGLTSANYKITYVSGTLIVSVIPGSIYVLDPTAGGALTLSGNSGINTSGTVVADSNSTSAILASGNASVTAGGVQVVGGVSRSGNAKVAKTGTPGATGDPLAGLAVPAAPSYVSPLSESLSGNASAMISAGIYSQISVSGNAKLTLNPGVYVIGAGGVTVSGNGSLQGSGVTYILEGGSFTVSGSAGVTGSNVLIVNGGSIYPSGGSFGAVTLSGNGTVSLTPCSTGADAGILILQPKANSKPLTFSGNAMQGISGTIYAPGAQLAGSGNAQIGSASSLITLIVDTLSISGSAIANAELAADGATVYTPAQIRTAYDVNALNGINSVLLDGTGQTIAIVEAYDDPLLYQALDMFDSQFGLIASGPSLYSQYGPASSFLTVLNQNGQATSLAGVDPTGGWETEAALDVEWAHAMAPGAQILVVEANSQSLSDLMAAVATAASQPGVSVVSMSWGFPEGQAVFQEDEALYDGVFTTPAGHQPVTFVASTGDYGSADPEYPAFSPNVLAVGGTSLTLNADNSYNSETGWGYYSSSVGAFIGSGGGTSLYEPEPAYQQGVQSTGNRTTPDVSFVADPATGAWIADPYNLPAANPFEIAGGTSLSAPCWAGFIAIADQGRAAAGEATLSSSGGAEAQAALYSLPQSDFNSIISGTNGAYSAAAGYNMVTGLGTPVANLLVPDLIAYQGNAPANLTAANAVTTINANQVNYGATINVFNVFNVEIVGNQSADHGSALGRLTNPDSQNKVGLPVASQLSPFGISPLANAFAFSQSLTTPMNQPFWQLAQSMSAPADFIPLSLSQGDLDRLIWANEPLRTDWLEAPEFPPVESDNAIFMPWNQEAEQ